MKKRPVIGITSAYDYQENRMFVRSGYANAIISAGGLGLAISLSDDENYIKEHLDLFDGFLFVGGPDICASYYGEENLNYGCSLTPERDSMEIKLAQMAINANKPVLGICRGSQLINVAMGGTLYQDIHKQSDKILNTHSQDAPKWFAVHNAELRENSHLHKIFNSNNVKVNSFHHQAVKLIAEGFEATACAPDGIVEGIEHKSKKFVIGVQWHPELMWEKYPEMLNLFKYFIDKCGNNK